jgi:riboflavin synthase alpha subunit
MTRKLTVLLLLTAAMAWAQSEPAAPQDQQPSNQQQQGQWRGRGPRGNFQGTGGTITAIEGDTITLKTMDGKQATVKLTPETRYRRDRQEAKLSDFKVGDMVMVRGESSGENTWTAQGVFSNQNMGQGMMMMREEMGKKFIAGEVAKIDGTSLTINRPDGQTQVIQVDETTSFRNPKRESITLADIKVGDRVFGRGELKDGVFVPAVLNVGAPGEMRMMRREGQNPPPPQGGDQQPQQ